MNILHLNRNQLLTPAIFIVNSHYLGMPKRGRPSNKLVFEKGPLA